MGCRVQHQFIATVFSFCKTSWWCSSVTPSQPCCTLVSLLTVSQRCTSVGIRLLETCAVSCSVLVLLQQRCLLTGRELLASETGDPPWQKGGFGIFSRALTFTLKLSLVERKPNLKAFFFLKTALPNGRLGLSCDASVVIQLAPGFPCWLQVWSYLYSKDVHTGIFNRYLFSGFRLVGVFCCWFLSLWSVLSTLVEVPIEPWL